MSFSTDLPVQPMKVCNKCKQTFPANKEYFQVNTNGRGIGGVSATCKSCANARSRNWYHNWDGKEWHLNDQKQRRIELGEWVVTTFKSKPCTDCNTVYPPEVMEFDHLPGFEKLFSISVMVNLRKSKEAIINEIEKCELVCANCHRLRTVARGTWGGKYSVIN